MALRVEGDATVVEVREGRVEAGCVAIERGEP